MRFSLVYTILLLVVGYVAHAQKLEPVSYYLQHRGVSEDAIEFYTGRLTTKDVDKAMEVADSMFTNNDETRPFYLLLVTRMLRSSKGDLSKQLTVVCRHFAEQHPSELAAFLYQKNHFITDDFAESWAKRMSIDIRVMCETDLLVCFKQSRNIALANCDEQYKPKIEVLYNTVRRQLNLFQQR